MQAVTWCLLASVLVGLSVLRKVVDNKAVGRDYGELVSGTGLSRGAK